MVAPGTAPSGTSTTTRSVVPGMVRRSFLPGVAPGGSTTSNVCWSLAGDAGAAVASPLRQRNAEDLPDVTSALKERSAARPCGRRLVNSPQTARQAALRAMWDEAATENCGQYNRLNRLEVPHMLLDDVRIGDVVELNTPTAGQTFHVFVYEIAEDEVRYRYGLMGASVGLCLMSNIVRVVGPDEEGISI